MDKVKNKRILICINSSGLSNSAAQEAFDLALAAATFEQDVSILFEGVAANLLAAAQDAKALGRKDLQKALKAFPLYGINKLYVTQNAQQNFDLDLENMSQPCTALSPKDMPELFANHDIVMRF